MNKQFWDTFEYMIREAQRRIRKVDKQYKDKWESKDAEQTARELSEELMDIINYTVMLKVKLDNIVKKIKVMQNEGK